MRVQIKVEEAGNNMKWDGSQTRTVKGVLSLKAKSFQQTIADNSCYNFASEISKSVAPKPSLRDARHKILCQYNPQYNVFIRR